MFDPQNVDDVGRARHIVALHGRALLASAGDVAALHADLTEPSSILEHPDLLPHYRALKTAFDPNGILNPGKVLR